MAIRLTLVALALTGLVMSGCSKDPVNENHTGNLEEGDSRHPNDQSFYDEYTFDAEEGWQINVTMTSGAEGLQPYLQLRQQDKGDEWLQENAAQPGVPATISVVAPVKATYVIWANSLDAGQTGNYTLQISAQPPAGS